MELLVGAGFSFSYDGFMLLDLRFVHKEFTLHYRLSNTQIRHPYVKFKT